MCVNILYDNQQMSEAPRCAASTRQRQGIYYGGIMCHQGQAPQSIRVKPLKYNAARWQFSSNACFDCASGPSGLVPTLVLASGIKAASAEGEG